jgi:hypothetical protein
MRERKGTPDGENIKWPIFVNFVAMGLYLPNSVTKIPVPAETENFLGVLTGKPAFLLGHIARSLLLGLYGARGAPGRTMLIG